MTSSIKRFTETGVETEDGIHRELDIVFCATGTLTQPASTPSRNAHHTHCISGFDMSWQLPFSIIGRKGVDINEKWKPYPKSYIGMCTDGFPNMFTILGPNSLIGAGTLLPIVERAVLYAVQAVAKMQRERLKSIEAKPEAVRAFDQYIEVRSVVHPRPWPLPC